MFWSINRPGNRHYLDDFLIIAESQNALFLDIQGVRVLLSRLGFLVNEAKSRHFPSSRVDCLGVVLDLEAGRASPLPARIDSLVSCAEVVRGCRSVEAHQFLGGWA
jgi:hypothetical protein